MSEQRNPGRSGRVFPCNPAASAAGALRRGGFRGHSAPCKKVPQWDHEIQNSRISAAVLFRGPSWA